MIEDLDIRHFEFINNKDKKLIKEIKGKIKISKEIKI